MNSRYNSFYELTYFRKSDEPKLCADDFRNKTFKDLINLSFIVSVSDLIKFTMPFSGEFVGDYAMVSMSDGVKYFILEQQHKALKDEIKGRNNI